MEDGKHYNFLDEEGCGWAEGYYRNGVKNGYFRQPKRETHLYCEGKYKDGKPHGLFKFWQDNRLFYELPYVDGSINGTYKSYYPYSNYGNGYTAKIVGEYRDGERYGSWVEYHDDGKIKNITNYVNSKLNGPYTAYDKDGMLLTLGNYTDDLRTGRWEFVNDFTSQGYSTLVGVYEDGKKNGIWRHTSFHQCGDVVVLKEMHFLNETITQYKDNDGNWYDHKKFNVPCPYKVVELFEKYDD